MVHAGQPTASVILSNRTIAALTGGLVGGVAFGVLMQLTGIVFMVAALVNRDTAVVGWIVHLLISLLFAVIYMVLFGRWMDAPEVAIILGIAYGWLWWVLGGMIIMPVWLGMNDLIFTFNATAWQGLAGHILYGGLLGMAYAAVLARLQRTPVSTRG